MLSGYTPYQNFVNKGIWIFKEIRLQKRGVTLEPVDIASPNTMSGKSTLHMYHRLQSKFHLDDLENIGRSFRHKHSSGRSREMSTV